MLCVCAVCVHTCLQGLIMYPRLSSCLSLLSAEFQTLADVPRVVCSCVQRFFGSTFSLLSEIQNALVERLCWGMVFEFEDCSSFFKKDILNV